MRNKIEKTILTSRFRQKQLIRLPFFASDSLFGTGPVSK